MSRYVLSAAGFGEVVVGWDQPIDGFFLQCFVVSENEDDFPALWLPKLDLDELEHELTKIGSAMPPLLRRTLLAEMHGQPLNLEEGTPVLWGGRSFCPAIRCTVIRPLVSFVAVRWPNGEEHLCLYDDLQPDLTRLDEVV